MLASTLLTCAYIVGYWLLLWRRDVVWTPRRVRSSLLLALGAVAAGIVLAWLISLALPYEEELGTILGSLAATVIWIGATVFAWRETPGERAARLARAGADTLVCPSCGYNLTGLREARCPECGNSFTLNDLLAGQPERVQMEVERA